MFSIIEREETLTNRVTGEVQKLILNDLLRPGDRLPAERDLAIKFQVSRTVVREAIRSLAAQGLVDVQQGRGTVVCVPSVASLTPPMTLLLKGNKDLDHAKVIEVRRVLEIEIAGIAAERRTSKDLEAMEQILENRHETRANREAFVEWDMAFHAALAKATGNELFSLLLDSVAAVMRKVREVGFDVPGTPERAYRYHRLILDEVAAGDPAKAREAMIKHLAESEQTMAKALKREAAKATSPRKIALTEKADQIP